ncbi:GNAT family N-acetyltransferase [Actinoplanes sp. NPDC024001]|uniref:GNAT family N-acetyltransferase n=1 Tax=Actinoplanes sp. NPDC024001 TaxID=3154598 RepID=UPI0033C159B9
MTPVGIRPAGDMMGQAAAIFEEYRVHYGQTPDPEGTRRWLTEQLGIGRLAMSVAVRGEHACGLITSTVMPASLRLGTFWFVRDLFVTPDQRRTGTARALLERVIADARAAGAIRVSLQTEPENEPALALYTAAGFRPVEGLMSLALTLS